MKRKAFTIVEVVLVVLVIALVSTLAAFDVYRELDSTMLRSSSLGLQRAARYARLIAGQKHQPCRLYINLDEGTYWLTIVKTGTPVGRENEDVKATGILEGENVYSQARKLPEKLHFRWVQVEGDKTAVREGRVSIAFNVDGSAQAGLIQISSENAVQTLLIYPCTARSELYGKAIDDLPSETIDLDARGAGEVSVFE